MAKCPFWHISNPSLIVAQPLLHQDLLLLPPSFITSKLCSLRVTSGESIRDSAPFSHRYWRPRGGRDLIKALLKIAFAFHLKPLSLD